MVSSSLIATIALLCLGAGFARAAELIEPQEVAVPAPEDLQAESYSALDLQTPTVSELTPAVSFTHLDLGTDLETEVNQIAQSEVAPSKPQEELPEESEAESGGANTGQDPTDPLTRVDLRVKYQDLSDLDIKPFDDQDLHSWLFTLRADKPFLLGDDGWVLGTRIDIPIAVKNIPSLDNIDGNTELGLSDALIQLLFIAPSQGEWTFAAGTQVIFPTATEDQFGTGKWQLAPIVAAKLDLAEITPGSFVALLLRDQFSFAGDGDRNDIHQLAIQPVFNVNLPQAWFVTVAPEIRLDWNEGDWFVPFDISIGKLITPSVVASLEFKTPIVDDLDLFQFEVEARVGFFF